MPHGPLSGPDQGRRGQERFVASIAERDGLAAGPKISSPTWRLADEVRGWLSEAYDNARGAVFVEPAPSDRSERHTRPMAALVGKYRATVDDNVDPLGRARLRLSVPSQQLTGVWAVACLPPVPAALLVLPDVGATVWIEFEGGDPEHPVWSGVARDYPETTALRVVPQS